jgi:3,4-dihydroxy-2-butanone 4-phosphate synthase
MIHQGRGILLAPMQEEYAGSLGLAPLGDISREPYPITIGIEARSGLPPEYHQQIVPQLSGLSLHGTKIKNNNCPRTYFPPHCSKWWTTRKSGIAEASLDLLKIARVNEIGALTHVLNSDGEYTSKDALTVFCGEHKSPLSKYQKLSSIDFEMNP